MPYIAERLLRLLSLLNAGHNWRGEDLAERMGVTPRTVRRDVDRLRDLGYEVHSLPGPAGGYRLGAGTTLPPMLLDDEAAVAVAVGLRAAADGAVTGMEEAAARFVARGMSTGPYKWQARVLMDAPASVVADRVPPTTAVIEAAGDQQCVLVTGSDSLDAIAFHLAMVNVPFTPLDPPELKDRCAELSRRLSQAAAPSAPHADVGRSAG